MFEIHITVVCLLSDFEKFKETCKSLGVKALAIYLNNDESHYHIMTSSIFYGDFSSVYDEVNRISLGLGAYPIVRQKIETTPKSVIESSRLSETLYYEVHIEVDNLLLHLLPKDLTCSWYVSNNLNKPDYTILTCRLFDWEESINIRNDYNKMVDEGLLLDSPKGLTYEFAIFDTNPELDNGWIK